MVVALSLTTPQDPCNVHGHHDHSDACNHGSHLQVQEKQPSVTNLTLDELVFSYAISKEHPQPHYYVVPMAPESVVTISVYGVFGDGKMYVQRDTFPTRKIFLKYTFVNSTYTSTIRVKNQDTSLTRKLYIMMEPSDYYMSFQIVAYSQGIYYPAMVFVCVFSAFGLVAIMGTAYTIFVNKRDYEKIME